MKGFICECLVLGGSFLYVQQPYVSLSMICVGALGALGRYVIDFNSKSKIDKILEAGEKIVTAFTESALSSTKESPTIHWEKVDTQKDSCN